MKTLRSVLSITVLSLFILSACGPAKKQGESESAAKDLGKKKYTVYKAPPSLEYPNASLELLAPGTLLDTGKTEFKFEVKNYELGVQTDQAATRGIANSAKGQHIHFILNNDPYSAHYTPEFTKDLPEGNHVLLAFLSRSYHEAVKNENAYVLQEFTVGTPEDSATFDPDAPHLFYSRPKGTYSGADTEKLMIDFFLFNTSISKEGNKVKATINGEEHMITEWAPYYVEGLEKGEVNVKLELIDKDGKLIPGPYNSVERKVTLE